MPGDNKRWKWKFAVPVILLTAIGLLVALAWNRRTREPVYQGKPLSEWLAVLDNYTPRAKGMNRPSPKETEGASKAVREIGTNGLPFVAQMIRHKDSKVRRIVEAWLMKFTPLKITPELPAQAIQLRGVIGIWTIGSAPKNSVSELISLTTSTNSGLRAYAIRALGTKGVDPIAIPTLVQALQDTNPEIRAAASGSLWRFGRSALSVAPELAKLAKKDPDDGVRQQSAETYSYVAGDVASTISLLVEKLDDPRQGDRSWAAGFLGRIGPPATNAVPGLKKLLADTSSVVRREATNALERITGNKTAAGPGKASMFVRMKNLPVSQALSTYASLAQVQLDLSQLPGSTMTSHVDILPSTALSKEELTKMIEDELVGQAGVGLEKSGDGKVTAVLTPGFKSTKPPIPNLTMPPQQPGTK